MKTFLIVLVSLVVGGVLGAIGAFGVGAGVGAGAGIVVGAQAGACMMLEAAKEKGLVETADIDTLLQEAVERIRAQAPAEAGDEPVALVSSEADCAEMIAKLRAGGD